MTDVQIKASDVKDLRERTGAAMMDCKSALTEAGGDPDKAIEILRVKGQAHAAKRKAKHARTPPLRLPEPVIARQIERTDLSQPAIGPAQTESIKAAGLALQQAGVIPVGTDVAAAVDGLLDPSFNPAAGR